jgi:hypothetical protein
MTSAVDQATNALAILSGGSTNHYSTMYVRGDFNGWATSTPMTYQGSHLWSVTTSLPGATISYKFDASGSSGVWPADENWGDSGTPGIADADAGDISFSPSSAGNYQFLFNESTLAYSVTPN